jgi:hypothetical protein
MPYLTCRKYYTKYLYQQSLFQKRHLLLRDQKRRNYNVIFFFKSPLLPPERASRSLCETGSGLGKWPEGERGVGQSAKLAHFNEKSHSPDQMPSYRKWREYFPLNTTHAVSYRFGRKQMRPNNNIHLTSYLIVLLYSKLCGILRELTKYLAG